MVHLWKSREILRIREIDFEFWDPKCKNMAKFGATTTANLQVFEAHNCHRRHWALMLISKDQNLKSCKPSISIALIGPIGGFLTFQYVMQLNVGVSYGTEVLQHWIQWNIFVMVCDVGDKFIFEIIFWANAIKTSFQKTLIEAFTECVLRLYWAFCICRVRYAFILCVLLVFGCIVTSRLTLVWCACMVKW